MALNSVTKRLSVINHTMPYRAVLPAPDGTIDATDRQFFWLAAAIEFAETVILAITKYYSAATGSAGGAVPSTDDITTHLPSENDPRF